MLQIITVHQYNHKYKEMSSDYLLKKQRFLYKNYQLLLYQQRIARINESVSPIHYVIYFPLQELPDE